MGYLPRKSWGVSWPRFFQISPLPWLLISHGGDGRCLRAEERRLVRANGPLPVFPTALRFPLKTREGDTTNSESWGDSTLQRRCFPFKALTLGGHTLIPRMLPYRMAGAPSLLTRLQKEQNCLWHISRLYNRSSSDQWIPFLEAATGQ